MPPELSDYKQMVDGLTEGGFTDPQTRALVEFLGRVVSGLRDEIRDGFRAVNERFDRTDVRLEKMDERFDRTDVRLDRMDERFDRVDERFDRVDERFDKIDKRFDRTDGRIDSLYERIDGVKNWLVGGLSALILTLISALVTLAVSL